MKVPALFSALAPALLLMASASAQQAISARAGLINVADGDVFLGDPGTGGRKPFERKPTELVELREGQTLETGEGRAELLLTPGAFLRIGDSSAVRMHSSRLTSVRVELLRGAALADVVELLRDHALTLLVQDAEVTVARAGLYRLDTEPARIRVFHGQAEVRARGQSFSLKGGRELQLGASGWTVAKFDPDKETDALYRWSRRRAGYIAMANVSTARQAAMMSRSFTGGTWFWNPYFGFATYIPWSDVVRSPFGYFYYTPYTVMDVYVPPRRAPSSPGLADRGVGVGFPGGMPRRSAGSAYTPPAPVTAPAAAPGGGSVGGRGGPAAGGAAGVGSGRGGRGQ